MSFVTPGFFPFLAVYLVVSALLPQRAWLWFAALASSAFYAAWDWRFLFLLYGMVLLSWACGRGIATAPSEGLRRKYLVGSVTGSLAVLALFKYFNFFTGSFSQLLQAMGLGMPLPILRIALPVGISFYTFHALSYTIDLYRRRLPRPADLLSLTVYLAFFPQLMAGPIVRAWRFLPQIDRGPIFCARKIRLGLALIAWGYFLKVCVADSIGPVADRIFDMPVGYTSGDQLFAIFAYAFQIYGDFAGYSFIAIGVAKLQGFDFPANFLAPYFARSFSAFWRRWHISLSSFLRDYLYIPLGGNRHGRLKEYRNLMLTMVLGGLWHGASWNFAIWGGLHGGYLTAQKALGNSDNAVTPRNRTIGLTVAAIQMATVFGLTCLAWVFFRIHGFGPAIGFLRQMLSGEGWHVLHFKFQALKVLALIAIVVGVDATLIERRHAVWLMQRPALVALAIAVLSCLIQLTGNFGAANFIYFQF